jgi:ribosome biogenesis protein NSA1
VFLKTDQEEQAEPVTAAPWTLMSKDEAIECMALNSNKSKVWIAKKSGYVNALSMEDGSLLGKHKIFLHQKNKDGQLLLNKHRKPEHFIGIFYNDVKNRLISATDTGNVYVLNDSDSKIQKISLGQDLLCAFRVHPVHSHLLATGGDERELCVWDLSNHLDSTDIDSDQKSLIKPIWTSKNVKHDNLDLRVPVWITAIDWLPSSPSTLIVGTAYHHIRIYDTSKARRPIFSVELGKFPIRCLEFMPFSSDLVAIADNRGQLTLWNTSTQKIVKSFKGISGTITSICGATDHPWITVVGLDRYLRVFDANTGSCIWKIFLKQRLTSVKVMEKKDEDKLWDSIPVVDDISSPIRKKRKQ